MSDLGPLHRRLRRALDISSLIVCASLVPACASKTDDTSKGRDKQADQTDGNTQTSAKPPEPPLEDAPTTAVPPDPEIMLPSCPSGKWCGPKALIEPLRRSDLNTPIEDVEGCPGAIQGTNEIDESKFASHPGLPLHGGMVANIDPEATKAKRAGGEPDTCCYAWTELCPGGRPLLIDGRPRVASLRAGSEWSAELPELAGIAELPDQVRTRVAQAWLRDALTEHASIASFMRARAELAAIAAPSSLLDACERAAADEVEHARLCFGLAERVGGRSLAPGELLVPSPRGGGPLAVALDTFIEGCVGETVAAACARRAAALTSDPVVRGVLERIADDETEHAALAWRTIAWLVEREGTSISTALRERANELRPVEHDSLAPDPDAALLHAQGRLDRRELSRTRARVWRELIDPLLGELAPAQANTEHPLLA